MRLVGLNCSIRSSRSIACALASGNIALKDTRCAQRTGVIVVHDAGSGCHKSYGQVHRDRGQSLLSRMWQQQLYE